MRAAIVILALSSLPFATGCAAAKHSPEHVLAFPGAEGYGRHALGGRGGRVIRVTTLADDGPGSLRKAIQSKGARTIIFDVSGYIDLASELDINNGFVTIAGQTAPGDGITLRGYSLNVKADHVTVQWSIIAESLNDSVHVKGEHGYGTPVRGSGGARYTLHHNLWAHHRARMPRPGNYVPRHIDPIGPITDVRSNVFYNWGGDRSGYNADTESLARYSFVGNHYVQGPDSKKSIAFDESNPHARLYFADNWMNGEPVDEPVDVLRVGDGHALEAEDFSHGYAMPPNGLDDFDRVLETAGASLSRDAVDARIVADVRARTGKIIDDVSETPGWPRLESLPAPRDSDGDGMPDDWENSVGLDPSDAGDGALDREGDGYTNLEDYLNSLVSIERSSFAPPNMGQK